MTHLSDEMDHADIDDQQVVERYLAGRLEGPDRLRFEEHFLGCPLCQERLEAAAEFRRSLADVATDAVTALPERRSGVSGRLAALVQPRLFGLAAALLVATTAAALILLGELGRARRELAGLAQASAASRRSDEALEAALARERAARIELDERVRALPATAVGAAVFTLNLTRGGPEAAPDNRIVLPAAPQWIVLTVDRPGPRPFPAYRARLAAAGRGAVGGDLTPGPAPGGQLAVGFASGLLAPGDYSLTLEGLAAGGRAERLATWTFRAVPPS